MGVGFIQQKKNTSHLWESPLVEENVTSEYVPGTGAHLHDANMATEDVIVDNLLKFWRIPAVRRYFHWTFLFITLAGSILKELEVVPQSYFSHRRNVINVYVPLWC